ncbi:hypothetical protein MMC26_000493 [Xylographa opegraphella]|nr:hypothetical protein [Xylographa opegraphella]
MPRTWARNGGTARDPSPYAITPGIRKARVVDEDFGFSEEDAAIFAEIRTPEIVYKRKREPISNDPLQNHILLSARSRVPEPPPLDMDLPRLSLVRLVSILQPQRHRSPAATNDPKADLVSTVREHKRQRKLHDHISSSNETSGPYIPPASRKKKV